MGRKTKIVVLALLLFCVSSILTMRMVDEWQEYGYIVLICVYGAINTSLNIFKNNEEKR